MAKVTINSLNTLSNETAAIDTINSNVNALATAIENTISRDGTSPNTMEANLDMNSNRIYNLPDATLDHEPVTYGQFTDAIGVADAVDAEEAKLAAQAAAAAALASQAAAASSAATAVDAAEDAEYWAGQAQAIAGGATIAATVTVTPAGSIAATDVQAALEELDAEKQPLDATLTALAGVSTAANKLIYATGSDTFATTDITSTARTFLAANSQSAEREALGLGSAATRNVGTGANNVVALDSAGILPALNGSQLTGILAGNSIVGMQVFNTAGTFTYTPTEGATKALVIITGGGGSGRSGSSTSAAIASGGGAGATAFAFVTSLASVPIVVGAGGAAQTTVSSNGNYGSQSSFGVITADGGVVGTLSGGAGGSSTSGALFGIPGGCGHLSQIVGSYHTAGIGGSSFWGGGGLKYLSSIVGIPSYGAGGGGGTSINGNSQSQWSSQAGGSGIVYVVEFA